MLRGASVVWRSGGSMLHGIAHRHQQWRQGGQLYCAFCMSAWRKAEQDPIDSLKGNPFFNKYSGKLKQKQQEAPASFRAKVAEVDEQKQRDEEALAMSQEEQAFQVKEKKLENILKLDLIKDKTDEEIALLWTEYHKTKPVIFGVIPAEEYKDIQQRAEQYPVFVYPLPRCGGYEFFLHRFANNEIFFTPLLVYQQHKENAPPCLTITHYTELMNDKGLVLMVGEPDTNILSIHESQLLALQVKMYYGIQAGLKFNLVRQMNNAPETFRYQDLIREFENYKKDVKDAREYKKMKS